MPLSPTSAIIEDQEWDGVERRRGLRTSGNTATKCVAIGNRRHSLLLIIVGYFVRAAATFLFPGREMSASESRIFLDFRLFVCWFSDAGMTGPPQDEVAGGRKAPRHEVAGSWAPAMQRAL